MKKAESILTYAGGISYLVEQHLRSKIAFEESLNEYANIHGYYKDLAIISTEWPSRKFYIYKLNEDKKYERVGRLQDVLMTNCRNYEIYRYSKNGEVEFLYSEEYDPAKNYHSIINDNKIVRKINKLFERK